MEAFREVHQYDPFFPYILMYREQWHYFAKRVFHFHDWYEIVYVHSGEGVFIVNQSVYDMKEGDIFIVPGNAPHHTNPSKKVPYLVSVLLFDASLVHRINLGEPYFYLQSFEISRTSDQYRILGAPEDRERMERLLEEIESDIRRRERGYRHRALNALHQMLVELNALYALSPEQEQKRQMSKSEIWLKDILVYIDNCLTEDLTLPKLAKQALVSPDHFGRVFKERTGMNVPEYINMKRIIRAQGMMTGGEVSIPYVSDACGFQSLSHFYRVFRKHFHMTPGQYQDKLAGETTPIPTPMPSAQPAAPQPSIPQPSAP